VLLTYVYCSEQAVVIQSPLGSKQMYTQPDYRCNPDYEKYAISSLGHLWSGCLLSRYHWALGLV